MEHVNINDLVRSTVSLLNSELIGRDISLRLDLDHAPLLAQGDSVQLQQVLLNLVMNAMDAMASLGRKMKLWNGLPVPDVD